MKLSETLQQVKTFNTKTYACPRCGGRKNITNPDGSVSHCVCVLREQFLTYLDFLQHIKTLTDTPLAPYITEPQSIMLGYPSVDILHAHLKTALVGKRNMDFRWKCMTPDQILGALFESDKKHQIYSPQLLIILSSTFPHYEAAGNHINYVLRTRETLGKVTWFCCPDVSKIIVRDGNKGIVEDLHAFLIALPRVLLPKEFTIREIKNNPIELSDFASRLGIQGIQVKDHSPHWDDSFVKLLSDHMIEVSYE